MAPRKLDHPGGSVPANVIAWFAASDADALLMSRGVREHLSSFSPQSWPEATRLTLLFGAAMLRKTYGAVPLSMAELAAAVDIAQAQAHGAGGAPAEEAAAPRSPPPRVPPHSVPGGGAQRKPAAGWRNGDDERFALGSGWLAAAPAPPRCSTSARAFAPPSPPRDAPQRALKPSQAWRDGDPLSQPERPHRPARPATAPVAAPPQQLPGTAVPPPDWWPARPQSPAHGRKPQRKPSAEQLAHEAAVWAATGGPRRQSNAPLAAYPRGPRPSIAFEVPLAAGAAPQLLRGALPETPQRPGTAGRGAGSGAMAVSPAAAQADAAAAQARAQLRAAEEQYSALLEEARTTEARAAQARAAVQAEDGPLSFVPGPPPQPTSPYRAHHADVDYASQLLAALPAGHGAGGAHLLSPAPAPAAARKRRSWVKSFPVAGGAAGGAAAYGSDDSESDDGFDDDDAAPLPGMRPLAAARWSAADDAAFSDSDASDVGGVATGAAAFSAGDEGMERAALLPAAPRVDYGAAVAAAMAPLAPPPQPAAAAVAARAAALQEGLLGGASADDDVAALLSFTGAAAPAPPSPAEAAAADAWMRGL